MDIVYKYFGELYIITHNNELFKKGYLRKKDIQAFS